MQCWWMTNLGPWLRCVWYPSLFQLLHNKAWQYVLNHSFILCSITPRMFKLVMNKTRTSMLPRVQSDVSHPYWSLLPFMSNVLGKELNFCHSVDYVLIILCYQNILFCFLGLHCAISLHMSILYQAERWNTIFEQSFVDLFWENARCDHGLAHTK